MSINLIGMVVKAKGVAMVTSAPVNAFFARPGHPYSLGLVQAVPRADAPLAHCRFRLPLPPRRGDLRRGRAAAR